MPRLALTGGDYTARTWTAAAQRCVNLYGEQLPQIQGEPETWTYYPTPGLTPFCAGLAGPIRGMCQTSGYGLLYVVAGDTVYYVSPAGAATACGTIGSSSGVVHMQDNGIVLVITDGSASGWYLTVPQQVNPTDPGAVVQINDEAFYGSLAIAVLDTFLIFVNPTNGEWYVSPSNYAGNSTPFDALYVVKKTTYPDFVKSLAFVSENIWIIGAYTTEVWYTSGASDFPFARVEGVAFDLGTPATNSVVFDTSNVFFLANGAHGGGVVMMGSGTNLDKISTFAIESQITSYALVNDAIGSIHRINGHTFYCLKFPSADACWCYDVTTGVWHERVSIDTAGNQSAAHTNFYAAAYEQIFADGPTPGTVYLVDQASSSEGALPILRLRTFQHIMPQGRRMRHDRFSVDMTPTGAPYTVVVNWSDDHGATFCSGIHLSMGPALNTMPTVYRLGITRDRVYQVSWTDAAPTALHGAFIDVQELAS